MTVGGQKRYKEMDVVLEVGLFFFFFFSPLDSPMKPAVVTRFVLLPLKGVIFASSARLLKRLCC